MKRVYVRPMIESEAFVPNEYITACYYGNCNIDGNVYTDNNDNGIYDEGIDTYKYTNSACKNSFEIIGETATKPGANAFIVGRHWVWDVKSLFDWGYWSEEVTPVYNFDDTHVSTLENIIQDTKRPNHS